VRARDWPNGVHELAPYVKALVDSRTGFERARGLRRRRGIPIDECSKPGNTVAANADDTQTANLEGEKALDCGIVVNFVDAEALMSELRDRRVLEPGEVGARHHVCMHGCKGTIKAEFVISNLEATGTWDFGNAPGEVELGGASWDIHVKDEYFWALSSATKRDWQPRKRGWTTLTVW
jgi:hypothetical protein